MKVTTAPVPQPEPLTLFTVTPEGDAAALLTKILNDSQCAALIEDSSRGVGEFTLTLAPSKLAELKRQLARIGLSDLADHLI